jgi:hypothetical protein
VNYATADGSGLICPKVKPEERPKTERPDSFAECWTSRCSRSPASPDGGCQAAKTVESLPAGQRIQLPHHPPSRAVGTTTHLHNAWCPRRLLGRTLGVRSGWAVMAGTPAGIRASSRKLAVPGRTDLASADAGRTRCHSREDCGVYSSRAVTEKRRVENDKGLTCT